MEDRPSANVVDGPRLKVHGEHQALGIHAGPLVVENAVSDRTQGAADDAAFGMDLLCKSRGSGGLNAEVLVRLGDGDREDLSSNTDRQPFIRESFHLTANTGSTLAKESEQQLRFAPIEIDREAVFQVRLDNDLHTGYGFL